MFDSRRNLAGAPGVAPDRRLVAIKALAGETPHGSPDVMMRASSSVTRSALLVSLAGSSAAAEAHGLTWPIVLLLLSPFVAVLLSLLYGFVTRRWKAALGSIGLVLMLVGWFWAASAYTTSDVLVWIPAVALELQVVALLLLLLFAALRRWAGRARP